MLVQHRNRRKARLTVGASWKTFRDDGARERTVLFWSGGKDSFLTLRALQRRNKARAQGAERITLLTTFDGKTGKIPFQDTKVTILNYACSCGIGCRIARWLSLFNDSPPNLRRISPRSHDLGAPSTSLPCTSTGTLGAYHTRAPPSLPKGKDRSCTGSHQQQHYQAESGRLRLSVCLD